MRTAEIATKISFFTLLCILSQFDTVYAANCRAGEYGSTMGCRPCSHGCWCPGGQQDEMSFINPGMATDYCVSKSTKLLNMGKYDNALKLCPSSFPFSQTGAKSAEECYNSKEGAQKIYNKTVKCPAGKYLPSGTNTCDTCKKTSDSRYYCPGITHLPSYNQDFGLKMCPSGKVANSGQTACVSSSSNTSLQGGSVGKCKAGQYLPANTKQCISCSNLDSRYYCPGGQAFNVASFDQGLNLCPANKVADKFHTSCIVQNKPTVRCEAGQYLPATASVCTDCPGDSRYYCPGGVTFNVASFDQGLKTCEYGKEANDKKTACITVSAINVPAGQYLPADKVKPVTCKGSTNYCPGGQFDMESFDQGIFECPFNSRANTSKSACTITISKVQMQYGASGTGTPYPRQCWHQTDDPSKYMSCVLANSVSRYYK